MKTKSLLALTALLLGTSIGYSQRMPPPENRKVQVAILFDTSNSMDGLIDQAKSRIWNIVNEVSTLQYNNEIPTIEIALYQYGNDNLDVNKNYIQQILGLTSDLDVISQKLFGLTTNGGSEYCGAVIGRSLEDLTWSSNPSDLKMIYIAGNESFAQGPINYKLECKKAAEKGVYINTIFCGDYDQGIRLFWKDGSECTNGDYFNIDSDRKIAHIATPYDEKINTYNDSLNTTYYGYGSMGRTKKAMQVSEDANAEMEAVAVKTERSIVKSKTAVYSNATWDMIDGVDEGVIDLKDVKEEDLPEEFKGKTTEEKNALLNEKRAERERYQAEIEKLSKQRQDFISEEQKRRAEAGEEVDDFGSSVNKSINEKALKAGFNKEAQNEE